MSTSTSDPKRSKRCAKPAPKDNSLGITPPVIYRLAHAGGIHRMQHKLVEISRQEIASFLSSIAYSATVYMEGCNRRTLQVEDIKRALKLNNRPQY